ncbi:hypothetical protein AXE65_12360 [Ventosimonas gracilis]|uniref:Toxin co-regulated pilus biosynthesis protein Q C-terminal domain-containing protein n=1 Tax=Ventosimonas gracilis TaxID=1680762 RepID=A0A139SW99_9GAMM|nr:TcpQ domain-containing protein [Ventosimonas gracilis]KXU38702.1 hypothetical protein AXE65_12360 [Ventosimonas gracilis]
MRDALKGTVLLGVLGLAAAPLAAWAQTDDSRTALASEASERLVKPAVAEQAPSRWQLRRGLPVHSQLLTWAQQSGWTLTWKPRVSWLVAADVEFSGHFEQVLGEVIEGLFFEGKPIRLVLWEGNRLAEVVPSDVL